MTVSRKKQKKQYTLEELYNPRIDLQRDACLYGRQSTKDQVLTNIQSHISQTIMLLNYVKELGFTDDGKTGKATLFVENQVIDADGNVNIQNASGTWPIDRRPGLKTICDLIESNKVGVVVAEFVDRLFRDEDRIDSNIFIKVCKEHHCFVHISSKRMTYNFANPQHSELFRLEVQMAAAYIENHVRGTMHRRRSIAAQSGLWAGLGSIPVGYITDRDEESSTHGKFIIYEPHAKIVRWLFVRFVELGYDLVAFKRELQKMPYIFPPFEAWVNKADYSKCNLKKLNGGYSLTYRTLETILTNETYIGTFKREGAVRKHNHPAIVEDELFWSVYDHVNDYRPDGTPTNRRPVRYAQKNSSVRQSLLTFTSNQENVSVYFGKSGTDAYYTVKQTDLILNESLFVASADDVENAIIHKLFEKLKDINLVDLEQKRKDILREKMSRIKDLERDTAAIDEEVEILTENLGKVRTNAVVEQIEKKISKLLTRRKASEDEINKIKETYSDSLGTLEEELEDLETFWDERPYEMRKALLSLLIKKATLVYISPRFYGLAIEWSYADWGIEYAFFDKGTSGKMWTEAEDKILTEIYKEAEQIEILKALPIRSWRGILHEAKKLGIREGVKRKKNTIDEHLSFKDVEFLESQGLTLEKFQESNGVIWYTWSLTLSAARSVRRSAPMVGAWPIGPASALWALPCSW